MEVKRQLEERQLVEKVVVMLEEVMMGVVPRLEKQ